VIADATVRFFLYIPNISYITVYKMPYEWYLQKETHIIPLQHIKLFF